MFESPQLFRQLNYCGSFTFRHPVCSLIWFKENHWRISEKEDLGTTINGLKAKAYWQTCPDMEDLQWIYWYTDAEGEKQSPKAGNDLRIFPYSGKQ